MSTLGPLYHAHSRCSRDAANFYADKTIHLVKNGREWNEEQLDILKLIADTYPDFKIHNIILETSMQKYLEKRETVHIINPEITTQKPEDNDKTKYVYEFDTSFLNKIEKILLEKYGPYQHKKKLKPKQDDRNSTLLTRKKRNENVPNMAPKSYEDIIGNYKNIITQNTTYKIYFNHGPLQYYWSELSPEMITFAVRVQEMWQNGGITFYLPENNKNLINLTANGKHNNKTSHIITNSITADNFDSSSDISQLKVLITNTRLYYNSTRADQVRIDGQGLHMMTKTLCHSFFGEILTRMRNGHANMSVSDLIQQVLNLFCKRGAVDSDYCKTFRI